MEPVMFRYNLREVEQTIAAIQQETQQVASAAFTSAHTRQFMKVFQAGYKQALDDYGISLVDYGINKQHTREKNS
jgi:hypothetical protein